MGTLRKLRFLKWLYPGLKVKRWLVLATVGAMVFGAGVLSFATASGVSGRLLGLVEFSVGLSAIFAGLVLTVRSLLEAAIPGSQHELVDVVFQRRCLEKGLKVVAIGGGTGLSTLLQGLKLHTSNITAIVTVADDGGSSGRLRKQFGILPPGDLRNCLVALADAEPLMQRLFQYRFTEGSALRGHNFGNLFVTALSRVTGDFQHTLDAASRVLAIRGRVMPSTYANVQLVAEHDDGSCTIGETKISHASRAIRRLWLDPCDPPPIPETLRAIRAADVIVIGPGSLFTSLIPNLLVPGLVEAIVHSAALKVYVCNVMTQFRETNGFTASAHVQALTAQTHPGLVDVCILNTGSVSDAVLENYRTERAFPVEPDVERIRELGYHVVTAKLVGTDGHARHDSHRLARLVIQLAEGSKREFPPRRNGRPPDAGAARPVPPRSRPHHRNGHRRFADSARGGQ